MLAAASVGVSGYYEVERVVSGHGGLTFICTPGWGGFAGGPNNAGQNRWKDFVDELLAYYNTPGRLAVFRRKFDNAQRRPGLDLATFAT